MIPPNRSSHTSSQLSYKHNYRQSPNMTSSEDLRSNKRPSRRFHLSSDILNNYSDDEIDSIEVGYNSHLRSGRGAHAQGQSGMQEESEKEVDDEETWFEEPDLYMDHLKEIYDKYEAIDDDIWCKIICMERNRRVAKAYVRVPVVTINGSLEGFDGFRIGLGAFENRSRDSHVSNIKSQIAQGLKIKLDKDGSILAKKISIHRPVYIKGTSKAHLHCFSDDVFYNDGVLEYEKPTKIFDMKLFKDKISSSIKQPNLIRHLQFMSIISISFVEDHINPLKTPCWIMIINIAALDILKDMKLISPIPFRSSLNHFTNMDAITEKNFGKLKAMRRSMPDIRNYCNRETMAGNRNTDVPYKPSNQNYMMSKDKDNINRIYASHRNQSDNYTRADGDSDDDGDLYKYPQTRADSRQQRVRESYVNNTANTYSTNQRGARKSTNGKLTKPITDGNGWTHDDYHSNDNGPNQNDGEGSLNTSDIYIREHEDMIRSKVTQKMGFRAKNAQNVHMRCTPSVYRRRPSNGSSKGHHMENVSDDILVLPASAYNESHLKGTGVGHEYLIDEQDLEDSGNYDEPEFCSSSQELNHRHRYKIMDRGFLNEELIGVESPTRNRVLNIPPIASKNCLRSKSRNGATSSYSSSTTSSSSGALKNRNMCDNIDNNGDVHRKRPIMYNMVDEERGLSQNYLMADSPKNTRRMQPRFKENSKKGNINEIYSNNKILKTNQYRYQQHKLRHREGYRPNQQNMDYSTLARSSEAFNRFNEDSFYNNDCEEIYHTNPGMSVPTNNSLSSHSSANEYPFSISPRSSLNYTEEYDDEMEDFSNLGISDESRRSYYRPKSSHPSSNSSVNEYNHPTKFHRNMAQNKNKKSSPYNSYAREDFNNIHLNLR